MALFKILKGPEKKDALGNSVMLSGTNGAPPLHEGWAYVTDEGNLYVDLSDKKRVKINQNADYAIVAEYDIKNQPIISTYIKSVRLVSGTNPSYEFTRGDNTTFNVNLPLNDLDNRYVNVTGDTMTGTLNMQTENNIAINFRPGNASYYTTLSYQTTGNEALVFATKQAVTSFMFVNGEDSVANHTSNRWTTLSPTLQIKNKSVYVNSLIANGTNPSYNFYVNGTSYFNGATTINSTLTTNGLIYQISNDNTLTLGAQNTAYCHIESSALNFYFNKTIEVDGNVLPYTNNSFDLGSTGKYWRNIYGITFHGELDGNAATATAVKDRQTGTITYLNYGASALASTSWLAAWNGYELRAISPKVVQDLVQHSRKVTVDLSSLDNSKWFPVTGTSLPNFGYNKIKVSVQLNSGTVPSWSTHTSGFTCNMELYVTAAGWGTTGGETIVLASSYSFASVDPCGFQQQSYNSMPVLWLRGGGKYFVETDFDCTWTVRTSSYNTYNSGGYVQTVAPTTTYPGIQGINGTIKAGKVYGAVWNDYAEYRSTSKIKPGQCVVETGLGDLIQSTKRLQPGANIVSDTFGFAIGETEKTKTPLAVSGRVLAYPYEDRYSYSAGDPVCSGPNGTISKMTREEVREYPDRIVGTVSEIPEYETWGTGNVKVDGRVWIKVR